MRRAADGTGSPLLCFIEHYLFYSFCFADVRLHEVASFSQLKQSNTPPHPAFHEKSGAGNVSLIFLCLAGRFWHLKSQFSVEHLFSLLPPSVSAGILKFHEVYLGEGLSEGGPEFQEGGSGGVISGSSLEQHIASAREALGVESYYSR